MRSALDDAPHDPAVLQHPQVLGDRGLGHPEAGGGLTDRRRALGEPLDDAAADRVRERPERIVNHLVNDSKGRAYNADHEVSCTIPNAKRPTPIAMVSGPTSAGQCANSHAPVGCRMCSARFPMSATTAAIAISGSVYTTQ